MTKEAEQASLAFYPKHGTYAELLCWHMDIWGTRKGGNTLQPGKPWTVKEFAFAVHGENLDPAHAEKTVRNWRGGTKGPPNNPIKIKWIEDALFGDDGEFKAWKTDLRLARERSSARGATRIAKREIIEPRGVSRPTVHFMGRDEERDALAKVLISEDRPAVLIQGGPGIGKTELTKAIAHHPDVAARFGERRYFVPLETATSAGVMQDAIARAIGCDPQYGFQAALDTLRDGQTLLVLDNLETPWEPEQQATHDTLAELSTVPNLAILASFRGTQLIDGARWKSHFLRELSRGAAIDLFVSVASKEAMRNDPHLHDFMQVLEGHPLSLNLVARHARSRNTLEQLWKEWTKIGTELAIDDDPGVPHKTSLWKSLELSLRSDRMTPSARRLYSLLGRLRDGLCMEDRDSLLGEDAFAAEQCLRNLGLVVEHLDCAPEQVTLLSPVRDHALRRLSDDQDRSLWVEHFLGLIKRYANSPPTSASPALFSHCLRNYENIKEALNLKIQEGDIEEAVDSLRCFSLFSIVGDDLITIFNDVIKLCHQRNDMLSEAKGLYWLGKVETNHAWNDVEKPRQIYENASALFRLVGDAAGVKKCDDEIKRLLSITHVATTPP